MEKLILTLIVSVVFVIQAMAQTAQGTILDDNGKPLKGVTIINLRSGTHAHADRAGYFILSNTVKGDSISVYHTGYQSRLLIYAGGTETDEIRLNKAIPQLNDVVASTGTSSKKNSWFRRKGTGEVE